MRRLVVQGLLLIIPFILWISFVFLIDPYNAIRYSPLSIPENIKKQTMNRSAETSPRDWTLYKMADFIANPLPNVLFGDCRAFDFPTKSLNQAAGCSVFNFGIPGAEIPTEVDLFWFIASKVNLKHVYFQVSFHSYARKYSQSIAKTPSNILRNPNLYFVDGNVARSTVDCAKRFFLYLENNSNASQLALKENSSAWSVGVRNIEKGFNSGYNGNTSFTKFKEIVDYCKSNSVKVTFFNMPVHPELHKLIREKGLENEYNEYLTQLNTLAELIDYDKPGEWVIPESYFIDPLHIKPSFKSEYYGRIISDVFSSFKSEIRNQGNLNTSH